MKKNFQLKRFIALLKYDLELNKKKYILFALGMFIVLFLVSYYHLDDRYRVLKTDRFPYKLKLRLYQNWFINYYLILSVLVAGTSFAYLRNKSETISFITLPASVFEKFCVEFLMRFIVFNILYFVFFWIDFKIAAHVFKMSYESNMFTEIPSFSILHPITHTKEIFERYAILCSLFSLATFMFAGASYFGRYAIFKTILAFGGLLLFAYVITLIFYGVLMPSKVNYLKVRVFDRKMENGYETTLIAMSIISMFSCLFLLPFTYFKLKEKEV